MELSKRLGLFLSVSFVLHVLSVMLLPDFLPTPKFHIIPVTLLTPVDLLVTKGPEGWAGHPVMEEITEQIWEGFIKDFPLELPAAEPKGVELLDIEGLFGGHPSPPAPKKGPLMTKELPKPQVEETAIASLKEALKPKIIKKRPRPLQIGIKGPVAARRLLYTPPPPKVKISVEAEVVLKFWVRPDGTVGRVIPLRKGDARLEAAGMEYIKGCLFEPLPREVPQVEMWGTLSVRSVLR